jgi:hypothetical protein
MTIERNTYYYSGTNVPCFIVTVTEKTTCTHEARAYVYDLAGVHVKTVIAPGSTRVKALTLLHTTVALVRENYMRECTGSVFNSVPILDPVVYNNLGNVGHRIADLLGLKDY